jgi:tRNA dimethylallyltransferase
MPKNLIIITGPTGAGKTDLAVAAAKVLGTEIVSADSRQIYRELKIGTAVPTPEQLKSVKHHFIGTKSIFDYYSAGIYETEALEAINRLFTKYENVIMVGGTGLYIHAVCNGIDDLPDVDIEIRNKLINRLQIEGIENLRFELKNIDPEYYQNTDIQNPKRILKALEIFYQTGKPYSSLRTGAPKKRNFNILKFGLTSEREELYARIDLRCEKMIEAGLVEETREFYPNKNLNSLNTVGYKEFFDYFDRKYSYEEAVRIFKRNSRHYAKRQMTWFRREKDIHWLEINNAESNAAKIIDLLMRGF